MSSDIDGVAELLPARAPRAPAKGLDHGALRHLRQPAVWTKPKASEKSRRRLSMGRLVGRPVGWGALFGGAAAFVAATGLAIHWSTGRTGHAGEFVTLMILWVPPVTIMGAGAAAVLFGVVALVLSLGKIEASPLSFAVLGSLLALIVVILPFASWVAGGLLRALQGAQGVYLLLPTALLPVAVAGLLTGWMVRAR